MQMDLLLQIYIKSNKYLLSYSLDLKVIPTYILLQINYMRSMLSLISLNLSQGKTKVSYVFFKIMKV